jgi:hypothetical protein
MYTRGQSPHNGEACSGALFGDAGLFVAPDLFLNTKYSKSCTGFGGSLHVYAGSMTHCNVLQ